MISMTACLKVLAATLVAILCLPLVASPASAHRTDPWHQGWSLWFDPAPEKNPDVFRLTVSERLTWPSDNPDAFYVVPRSFTVRLPEGFVVLRMGDRTSTRECTIQANTVECRPSQVLVDGWKGNPALEGSPRTLVIGVPQKSLPEGRYGATVTGTATLPDGSTQTESDSINFNLVYRGSADLVWTTDPPPVITLAAGKPAPLTYVLTNNGPDVARDVEAGIVGGGGSITAIPNVRDEVSLASEVDGCSQIVLVSLRAVHCSWPSLAVGEARRVPVIAYSEAVPNEPLRSFGASPGAGSYEGQPDGDNDLVGVSVQVSCSQYIYPSATVNRLAKVATNGCTVVGPDAVVEAGAALEKGSYVGPGGVVGKSARLAIGAYFVGDRAGRQATIGPRGMLGQFVRFAGEIGEAGVVGDRVSFSNPGWTIVEKNARIGSKSLVIFNEDQGVRVLSGARISDGTLINEDYCQANPLVCSVFPVTSTP